MASEQEYSTEELNYFRVCKITTSIIAKRLKVIFKQLWNTRYQATHGQWQDTAKNGIDLYSMESPKSRKRHSRELSILRNGNSLEWDCTCLFSVILYSDSIGKGLDPVVKNAVDDLRQFRNTVFAHVSDGRLTEMIFQTSIQTVIDAFKTLKLDIADIEVIKNQITFPTQELRVTKQQLEKEKMRNEEPQSFCVLPPKPSHEVIDRSGEIREILEEMKRLKSTKTNEITVVYLSGNPGCGKSEIARQIGEKVYGDDPENVTEQVKFVFTLNASKLDTLVQSYNELAISLKSDEKSTTSIVTSTDRSQEDKLSLIKSLVAPKLRKYSSWLLIVDNVTDVKSVFRYLPQVGEKTDGNGQILVTTQDSRSIGANDSSSYHLSLSRGMNPDEAVKTLSEISGIASDKECILRVARDLDLQPLALACAATYMKRVSVTKPSITWEEYLQKLEQGKRDATEEEFKRISKVYSQSMSGAVKLALEKEMAESMVMKHAFEFLAAVAPDRIPIEYIVQYITRCLPDQDEDLVAATVFSSSLILCSEDQSKEISEHQVVHNCLQYIVQHQSKKEESNYLANVINAFSGTLKTFQPNDVKHIIRTKLVIVHLTHLSNKMILHTTNPSSTNILNQKESKETMALLTTMGRICYTHAQYQAAYNFFKTVLIYAKNVFHPLHPSLASILNNLGSSLCDLGKHEEALNCFQTALVIEAIVYDENHPSLAVRLNNIGGSLLRLGKYEEAQKCYQRALAIQEKAYDKNHLSLAATLNNLGASMNDLGKYEDAQKCYRRALAIKEKAYDQNHPSLADTLNNLGNSLQNLEKYEEAQKCFRRALAIQEKTYDQNHPSVAVILNNLGNSMNDLAKYEDAQKCFQRALAIIEKAYDQNHPSLADTLNNLGNSLLNLGKYEDALKCYQRALAIYQIAYDQNHPSYADALDNQGCHQFKLGKYEEAQKCSQRALAIKEKAYDQNHPSLANTLNNLGSTLCKQGKYDEAQKCYQRALAIEQMVHDQKHQLLADTLNNLGNSQCKLGKCEDAQKCYERALAIREVAYDQNHPSLAVTLNNLGNNLCKLGKYEEAQKCSVRALAIQEMSYDQKHPSLAAILNNLGNSLSNLGKYEEAQKCYQRALAIKEMVYDENHPSLADTLNNLGNSLMPLGKYEEAKKNYERALAIQRIAYGQNHPELAATLNNLGNSLCKLEKYEEAQKYQNALAIQEMAYDFIYA